MGWCSFSMVSLKSWRSSARSMVSGLQASRRTPLRSKKPLRASSMERFRPICPPRLGRMASGFSFSMMRSTTSAVSGSIYTWSAMSGSVMMVAGLELTSTVSTPSLFSARQAWVPE